MNPPAPNTLTTLFSVLIIVQLIVIALHDFVNIPGWANGRQVKAVLGSRKLWLGTLSTVIFPALAAGFAFRFWHAPTPGYVVTYWVLYCGVTVFSAVMMWWVPYFFGAKPETKKLYADLYAGTKQVLPPRGDNPRPNLLHLWFHALFAINLVLAITLRFGPR
jgi:hypothetical protein